MALYSQFSYQAETYAGAPAAVSPPVETPLLVISRVLGPAGVCCAPEVVPGNVVTLEAGFYRAGLPADPLSLAVLIKDPSGDVTRYDYGADSQPVKTAVGHYYLMLYAEEGGEYFYRWDAGAGAAEGSFEVTESVFA